MNSFQDRLHYLFSYDPNTGDFLRKNCKSYLSVGSVPGTLIPNNSGNFYRQVSVDNKRYYMHVLIHVYILGVFPENIIDHRDGDGLNNKWENIRPATHAENLKNKKQYKNNSSGFAGVRWHKNSWYVELNGKHIGCFTDYDEACEVRRAKEIELNGEFAYDETLRGER